MHLSLFTLLAAASVAIAAPLQGRALPTPVSAATARTYLSSCKSILLYTLRLLINFFVVKVEAESNSPAYSRDLFEHWITS